MIVVRIKTLYMKAIITGGNCIVDIPDPVSRVCGGFYSRCAIYVHSLRYINIEMTLLPALMRWLLPINHGYRVFPDRVPNDWRTSRNLHQRRTHCSHYRVDLHSCGVNHYAAFSAYTVYKLGTTHDCKF